MKRTALAAAFSLVPITVMAQNAVVQDIVDAHILPRFEALATQSHALADAAGQDCTPTSTALRAAYGDAFDTWIAASHLRFGPTETNDRAFAIAFWPDSRGATPRTLNALIQDKDPIVANGAEYAEVSIAARGFYALEFLLFDDALMVAGDADYHCKLVQSISADIVATTDAMYGDWQSEYRTTLLTPDPEGVYRSDTEALQELFKALSTGLQFTSDMRLGRPLGTFDKPRPTRAEVYRSGRSAAHVGLSLDSLQDIARRLASGDAALTAELNNDFNKARTKLDALNDPVFAGVTDPQSRLKVEVLKQSVDTIRTTVRDGLGPTLGVAAGFNSLDGD
ncbi:imelysin family protein [Tateyamaria sp.]|uniref:imelysin family protein n=1 Tax=Tateyamaria sp. TaxID=1929288 RepID=UPI00329BA129